MRVANLLALPASLAAIAFATVTTEPTKEIPLEYVERLHLKPLSDRALYAGFNFTASIPASDYESHNFRFFPRSLAQILQFTHTDELHLRFALGRWDEENWGGRPRDGAREGGTGVELWAWLEAGTQREAEERWSGLVNSLSGLFCASLNFIEQSKTIQPLLTFEPEGYLNNSSGRLHLMHGMLPHEVVCRENLTPFLKLLPCKGKAGIASLLDGHKMFDANWQTMAIDVRQTCDEDEHCSWEIEQTVDMVLDFQRSMRPRDDPIPRPPPIEEVACDQSKRWNADDTCFPLPRSGLESWTLSQIFGRPIKGSCPLGDRANAADVVLEVSAERSVELLSAVPSSEATRQRSYRLEEDQDFDIKVAHDAEGIHQNGDSLLRASRQITGYGQERGGMHAVITNPHQTAQQVVYMESLPWFLRPFVHTLKVDGASIEKMFYTPAADRRRGTHLELLLDVPANSTVELSYDFEKAILRYTEYPPDANRGFDIAPAVIRVLPTSDADDDQGSYLRTTSLLLPLPTPDFSMPYNVIILTSTVLALGFGSIFNLLIRRFVLPEEVPQSSLANGIKKLIGKIKPNKSTDDRLHAEKAKKDNDDTTVVSTPNVSTGRDNLEDTTTLRRSNGVKRDENRDVKDS